MHRLNTWKFITSQLRTLNFDFMALCGQMCLWTFVTKKNSWEWFDLLGFKSYQFSFSSQFFQSIVINTSLTGKALLFSYKASLWNQEMLAKKIITCSLGLVVFKTLNFRGQRNLKRKMLTFSTKSTQQWKILLSHGTNMNSKILFWLCAVTTIRDSNVYYERVKNRFVGIRD